ncbi:hybrid sensor histidine kinase/response regulator [Albibacillus kandeliae]|uniref:hybrid sensor histidine kinase/response regulator n=1 Tax=Albibacillus kandeliae TaxID=2174228 RepID=UPI001E5CB218|nr:PAS domain-containing hybrid sensor histidine kinase/response regulator [Albibacillus kandeliae]
MFRRPASRPSGPQRPAPGLRALVVLSFAAGLGLVAAVVAPPGFWTRACAAAGLALAAAVGLVLLRRRRAPPAGFLQAFDILFAQDGIPAMLTDDEGQVLLRNPAAARRYAETLEPSLAGTLRAVFANPSAILNRLQAQAATEGQAREDVATRNGILRLSVHQVEATALLWRIEELSDRGQSARGAEALPVPLLTVGRSGAILFMNEAARVLIGARVKALEGVFQSLPVCPGAINAITTARGPIEVVVAEHGGGGRRELFLLPLDPGHGADYTAHFEALPVPLLKIAASGRILAANRIATRLLSIAPGEEDVAISDVMEGLGRPIDDLLRDIIAGDLTQCSEFLRLMRPDRETYVQVTLNRVQENAETVAIAVLNDATELKTLEAQFVQSQKMQAIGQLAGGVAHDFNNLLTAISGHCDLLLLRHDQGDRDYGDLVQINQNANRAAALVGQLLAFSRKQTLRPEVLDLRDTMADLTHLLNRLVGEKVELTLSHDPVLRPIRADKRQLEQVMMNLVVNARDAMPKGGDIRIETRVVTLAEPLVRDRATIPAGEYVTVTVADEGEGIATDKLPKVFEPFYTTKRTGEGTGLGLSTVYGIVKQTGGFIFADSQLGRGSTFTIYFPVYDPRRDAPEPAPPPVRSISPTHGEGVVLLVEDEAPVRAFASRALRLRGYTVLEADCAEDALHMLEDPDLSVDVFVTDVVMPGMDGPSWVRRALQTRPDVRVVFVSGYAEGAFTDGGAKIPNSVFLPKPFSLSQLTDTVHQQMN